MAALVVEVPPAVEPVDLATAKRHLRVSISNDDALIGIYIQAARELVENFTRRSLVNKGYRQSLDAFPYFVDTMMTQQAYPPAEYALPRYATTQWNYSQVCKLMVSPLVKVSRISYVDASGNPQTLLPAPFPWAALTELVIGDQYKDANGNLQEVVTANEAEEGGASLTAASAPTWGTNLDDITQDGDLGVKLVSKPAPTGDFVYDPDTEPPRIAPVYGSTWPPVQYALNAVQVHYVSGYGNDGGNAPATLKVAVMQLVGNWYENREAVSSLKMSELPWHVERLLWNERVLDFAPTRG